MKYKVLGDSDCPMIHIDMDRNEEITIERGLMAYMQAISIQGNLNSRSGNLFSAIGRSMTSGESLFITKARATDDGAYLSIAPGIPGKVKLLQIDDNHNYYLNTGGFFIGKTRGYGNLLIT